MITVIRGAAAFCAPPTDPTSERRRDGTKIDAAVSGHRRRQRRITGRRAAACGFGHLRRRKFFAVAVRRAIAAGRSRLARWQPLGFGCCRRSGSGRRAAALRRWKPSARSLIRSSILQPDVQCVHGPAVFPLARPWRRVRRNDQASARPTNSPYAEQLQASRKVASCVRVHGCSSKPKQAAGTAEVTQPSDQRTVGPTRCTTRATCGCCTSQRARSRPLSSAGCRRIGQRAGRAAPATRHRARWRCRSGAPDASRHRASRRCRSRRRASGRSDRRRTWSAPAPDVRPERERASEVAGAPGIVDRDTHAAGMGNGGDRRHVLEPRRSANRGFEEHQRRFRPQQRPMPAPISGSKYSTVTPRWRASSSQ